MADTLAVLLALPQQVGPVHPLLCRDPYVVTESGVERRHQWLIDFVVGFERVFLYVDASRLAL